jgi:hypothetical protein
MTATVTDDAELGFVSSEAKALLHEQPQAYQELLTMLTAKIVQTDHQSNARSTKEHSWVSAGTCLRTPNSVSCSEACLLRPAYHFKE